MHTHELARTDRRCISMVFFLFGPRVSMSILFVTAAAACAQLSVRAEAVQPLDPAAAQAIVTDPVPPHQIIVRDFEVAPSSIRENGSPLNRLINLLRRSPDEHRLSIGRAAVATLSEKTLKRLNKLGLQASRIPSEETISQQDDILLVTGRLVNANEGNRLTRIALGCGAGESSLDTEVHVFRVAYGESAEVLAFTTHADSGRMPGLIPSIGIGEFFIGPITALSKAKDTASAGLKIYSSQTDYLAGRTGDEVARYLSQYIAQRGWILMQRAQSEKFSVIRLPSS
jgi:hypothetical protein